MPNQQGQQTKMERLPHGNSQVHPDPNSQALPTEPIIQSGITAFSMAAHWEHLLLLERNRTRNLEYWVGTLQTQVRTAETDFDKLKQEHERLVILVQRHSCSTRSVSGSPIDFKIC